MAIDPMEMENLKIKGRNSFLVEISIPYTNEKGLDTVDIAKDLDSRLPAHYKIEKITKIQDWTKFNH